MTLHRWLGLGLPLILTAAVAAGCGGDDQPEGCDPNADACTFEAAVSTINVPAGSEDEDTCQSWTLNNPTELWVTGISQHNDGGYHHANWFFVPDDQFDLPDGTWSCNQNNFNELVAALLGGYLFALSTQSHDETQTLPPGSAIRIPPYSRVIGSSHLLNASDVDVVSTMRLSIHTVPPPQVLYKLAPARITYHDLHLDPTSRSAFTADVDLAGPYATTMGGAPLAYKLRYTLAHYHALGTYAELAIAGGPHDGEVIMRHNGYGENFGQAIEPPVDLAALGATGLRYTCGFDNPRDAEVGWGIGDQEMCVIALQAETDVGFDALVGDGDGQRLGPGADGEIDYQAPASIQMFPWDFTKPGGPPR